MRYVKIPMKPTKEILEAMATATFLSDLSDLEMHRRYNALVSFTLAGAKQARAAKRKRTARKARR